MHTRGDARAQEEVATHPGFGAILEARGMRQPDPATPPPGGPRAAAREALQSLERAQERLDRLLATGRAGRGCTALARERPARHP